MNIEPNYHCKDCGKIMYRDQRLGMFWCGTKNHEIITDEQILKGIPRK